MVNAASLEDIKEEINKETKFNIPGLVNQLSCNNYLVPLFEAVVNAIQSIQIGKVKNGLIQIYIDRLSGQQTIYEDETTYKVQPINNVYISDNGEGFNNKNLKSFLRAFTTDKIEYGCKGVGRFTWLKVFRETQIESIYNENGTKYKRQYTYKLPNGLQDETFIQEKVDYKSQLITQVKLIDLRNNYLNNSNQKIDTIARKLLEHCFYYMTLKGAPTIIVSGYDNVDRDKNAKTICLNELFKDLYRDSIEKQKITIQGKKFELMHVKLFDSGEESSHKIYFCANNRTVMDESIRSITKIASLNEKIFDKNENKKFFYISYLSGKYFDKYTDMERSTLTILQDANLKDSNYLYLADIKKGVSPHLKKFIEPYMESINNQKMEKIENFIKLSMPQYNYLLKEDKSFFEDISITATDNELKENIRKKHFKKRDEILEKFEQKLKETNKQEIVKYKEYKKEFDNLNKEAIESCQADLAEYVSHRKVVLNLLESYLNWNMEKNKHFEEKVVHDLIYPMGLTSDETPYEKHNLWIVDDRLAFSEFIASDKSICSIKDLQSKSKKEPDLLLFDRKNIFTSDDKKNYFESISIIEFKRPERKNYSKGKMKNENPIEQVLEYIDEINNGNVSTPGHRTIKTSSQTRYYCYIVCDISEKIKEFANKANLTPTPDGMGYFGYNNPYNAYIEVISFDKLLVDSQKRNHILFKKLGLE